MSLSSQSDAKHTGDPANTTPMAISAHPRASGAFAAGNSTVQVARICPGTAV